MENLHRIELAKQRLRKKLSYEYITSIEKYKDYSVEQYEKLIESIETLALITIDIYMTKHMDKDES